MEKFDVMKGDLEASKVANEELNQQIKEKEEVQLTQQ